MSKTTPDLDSAYALQTPDDNRKLYADWAETYDSGFAARMAYRLPALVAGAFVGEGPVLDVGAGTGLLGQALAARGVGPIDGIDISEPMLEMARAKAVYRDLMLADLTQPLASGAIARGHILAELAELLREGRAARTQADEITLFKSVGTALEDLAAAQQVLGLA